MYKDLAVRLNLVINQNNNFCETHTLFNIQYILLQVVCVNGAILVISDDLGRGHLLSILAIKGVKCDQNQLWHGNIMGKVRLEKNLRVCVTGG